MYPVSKGFLAHTAYCEKFKLSHKSAAVNAPSAHLIRARSPRFSWRLFGELIEPDVLLLLLATACAFCVAIMNIHIPIALGDLINTISDIVKDGGGGGGGGVPIFDKLYGPCVKLVWKYALQSSLTFLYICSLSSFGERLAARMRVRLFKSIMEQDVAFFDANKTGGIVSRLTTDIQDFKSSLKQVISQGLRSTTQILGCGVMLFKISPKLTYLMILVLPGIILIGTGLGSFLRQLSRNSQEQLATAMSVADEAIGNVRTVRAFAMEPKEIGWYSSEVNRAKRLSELLGVGIAAFQGLSNLAINGVVLVVLYAGAVLIDRGEMRPGDLMSYLIATQTVQKSLGNVSVLFGQLVRGMTAGTRVFEYMELRPSMKLTGGRRLPKDNIKGEITFTDVKFTYPTRPDHTVLHNLTLNIQAGKMTALCGSSGSGKSTIAALIEGLYEIDNGTIEIDGVNIKDLDPSWLRGDLIGYINQEPTLFATTVMENIRYGCPNAKDHEVYEAAKRANADGFIRAFPQGYDTVIGERGATVSGGQKQRIAIARALLKDPRILILDEATSALDAESEKIVQDAIEELIRGRTVIVIAHRLSTIQNADTIAAVSHGKIIEVGTHAELLDKEGLYAELIRRQTADI